MKKAVRIFHEVINTLIYIMTITSFAFIVVIDYRKGIEFVLLYATFGLIVIALLSVLIPFTTNRARKYKQAKKQ